MAVSVAERRWRRRSTDADGTGPGRVVDCPATGNVQRQRFCLSGRDLHGSLHPHHPLRCRQGSCPQSTVAHRSICRNRWPLLALDYAFSVAIGLLTYLIPVCPFSVNIYHVINYQVHSRNNNFFFLISFFIINCSNLINVDIFINSLYSIIILIIYSFTFLFIYLIFYWSRFLFDYFKFPIFKYLFDFELMLFYFVLIRIVINFFKIKFVN